jgi:hypothetical protein
VPPSLGKLRGKQASCANKLNRWMISAGALKASDASV